MSALRMPQHLADPAHVDSGEFADGDLVEIAECRPISRTKSWTVTRLVEKSRAV